PEVPAARLLAKISAAIRGRDLGALNLGLVRAEVERACGLEVGSLDARKNEINELIVEEAQRCIEADTPEKGPHRKSGRKRQRAHPNAEDTKRARSSGISGGPAQGPATAAQAGFLGSAAPLRVQAGAAGGGDRGEGWFRGLDTIVASFPPRATARASQQ
ncbi:unnamed protein product, partial [Prorocentrum cordatum]